MTLKISPISSLSLTSLYAFWYKEISKKWTMPVRDWELAYSQLAIFFEDRFAV